MENGKRAKLTQNSRDTNSKKKNQSENCSGYEDLDDDEAARRARMEYRIARAEDIRRQQQEEEEKRRTREAKKMQECKVAKHQKKQDQMYLDLAELKPPSELIKEGLDKIREVSQKPGNLKGTYIKMLKDAAAGIEKAVTRLTAQRPEPKAATIEKLERDNSKLCKEIKSLRRDIAQMKAEAAAQSQPLPPPQKPNQPHPPQPLTLQKTQQLQKLQQGNPSDMTTQAIPEGFLMQLQTMIRTQIETTMEARFHAFEEKHRNTLLAQRIPPRSVILVDMPGTPKKEINNNNSKTNGKITEQLMSGPRESKPSTPQGIKQVWTVVSGKRKDKKKRNDSKDGKNTVTEQSGQPHQQQREPKSGTRTTLKPPSVTSYA
ncbi:pinin-like [Cephus cinctus]|uniref:Pinin-like n=1 Tax=Cephus cinctus TaxID=211228 RepID=A0AAJ7RML2_CEPCN|nr:pinin-like [Cephus cinctus]